MPKDKAGQDLVWLSNLSNQRSWYNRPLLPSRPPPTCCIQMPCKSDGYRHHHPNDEMPESEPNAVYNPGHRRWNGFGFFGKALCRNHFGMRHSCRPAAVQRFPDSAPRRFVEEESRTPEHWRWMRCGGSGRSTYGRRHPCWTSWSGRERGEVRMTQRKTK